MATDHECTCLCSDVDALFERVTVLENAVCELRAALDTGRIHNNVAGDVTGGIFQAGTIDNLTIQ